MGSNMELIITAIIVLVATYVGYKMGKGEKIDLIPRKFKPIIRTPEQEAALINKHRKA